MGGAAPPVADTETQNGTAAAALGGVGRHSLNLDPVRPEASAGTFPGSSAPLGGLPVRGGCVSSEGREGWEAEAGESR